MKKTIALFSWIIVFMFLTSCKDVDDNCKMIDVIEAIRTPCDVSFNDIFELRECIPLQTSPTLYIKFPCIDSGCNGYRHYNSGW